MEPSGARFCPCNLDDGMNFAFWFISRPSESELTAVARNIVAIKNDAWTKPVFIDQPRDKERKSTLMNICEAMMNNASVRKLVVQNLRLDGSAMASVVEMLECNKHLRHIVARNLRSSQGDLIPIPSALFSLNREVEEISLSSCMLDDDGVGALIRHLRNNSKLKSLFWKI